MAKFGWCSWVLPAIYTSLVPWKSFNGYVNYFILFLFSRQNIIRISVLCILAVSRLVFFFFEPLRTFSISFLQVAFVFSKLYIGLWFSTRMSTILKPLVLADTFYSVHNYESHASSMNYSTSEGRVIWYDDLDQFCSCSESIAYVLEWFFYLFNGFDSLY